MTIKEFALLAGVSVSTVSKIMNGKDASISARTREHVLKLAKEYNYVPYASAAAPTTRTLTMGVIFQNTEHGKRLVSSILKEAASLGYSLLLRESGDSVDTELKNISAMAAAHTDGVIWEPVSSDSLFLGEKLDRGSTIVYTVCTQPTEKLYVSWPAQGEGGGEKRPAFLVDTLTTLFPQCGGTGHPAPSPDALRALAAQDPEARAALDGLE